MALCCRFGILLTMNYLRTDLSSRWNILFALFLQVDTRTSILSDITKTQVSKVVGHLAFDVKVRTKGKLWCVRVCLSVCLPICLYHTVLCLLHISRSDAPIVPRCCRRRIREYASDACPARPVSRRDTIHIGRPSAHCRPIWIRSRVHFDSLSCLFIWLASYMLCTTLTDPVFHPHTPFCFCFSLFFFKFMKTLAPAADKNTCHQT